MALSIQIALLLSIVSFANAAALNKCRGGHENAIATAVDVHFSKQYQANNFRLRMGFPASASDNSTYHQNFTLIIQETKCPKSYKNTAEVCPFKDGGVVHICTAELGSEHSIAAITGCEAVTPQLIESMKKMEVAEEGGNTDEYYKENIDSLKNAEEIAEIGKMVETSNSLSERLTPLFGRQRHAYLVFFAGCLNYVKNKMTPFKPKYFNFVGFPSRAIRTVHLRQG